MNKTNNNLIKTHFVLGLKILSVLVFSLLIIPAKASAEGGVNYVYNTYTPPIRIEKPPEDNPKPFMNTISPGFEKLGANARTITITGYGFTPTSIARVNANDRLTTFIDTDHLLIQLNGNDMYRTDGFFISVFNGEPGGGYSNAIYFTITNTKPAVAANVNNNNGGNFSNRNTSGSTTTNTTNRNNSNSNSNSTNTNSNTSDNSNTNDSTYSNLASNAIFGANGFMPSGLIQWIMFAIIILIIVILARKVFGAKDRYHASPLKHA